MVRLSPKSTALRKCAMQTGTPVLLMSPTGKHNRKPQSGPPVLPSPPPYNPGRKIQEPQQPSEEAQPPPFSPPTTQIPAQARVNDPGSSMSGDTILPLREAPHTEGNQGGQPFLVYVPFFTSDLASITGKPKILHFLKSPRL